MKKKKGIINEIILFKNVFSCLDSREFEGQIIDKIFVDGDTKYLVNRFYYDDYVVIYPTDILEICIKGGGDD